MRRVMHMRWFGKSWGSYMNRSNHRRLTPFWLRCLGCENRIKLGDQGVTMPYVKNNETYEIDTAAYHLDCFLMIVIGQAKDWAAVNLYTDEEE